MDTDSMNIEYEISHDDVVIDPYNCDLNLIVDKECLLAYPMSNEGFCSMWAGCRSTYGVNSGKVAFEIHLEDYCECTDLPKDDPEPYLIRVGWSLKRSSLQLGESPFSFAFCNNGKKCCDKVFEEYGETFEKGDSIACYLDCDTDKENIIISFSKNGLDLGEAFRVSKKEINDYILALESLDEDAIEDKKSFIFYPHVLTRNVVFEMNFGQRVSLIGDEPFAPIKADFTLMQKLPIDVRHPGDPKIPSKSDCEVILLIGLPGSGKTYWANEFVKKHPQKNYYLIGTSLITEKMKVLGQKKKPQNNAQNDQNQNKSTSSSTKSQIELLDKVLKCINTLIEIASQSNRNIILDQANVYPSARRRKLKLFQEFKKKAVVIVPDDKVLNQRLEKAKTDDERDIPLNLLHDFKTNFKLPNDSDYDSVEYIELKYEESKNLVDLYNKETAIERIQNIINKRNKKSEEKKLSSNINPAMLVRPGFNPRMSFPGGVGTPGDFSLRDPNRGFRHAGMPQNYVNYRRPLNPTYAAQFARLPAGRHPAANPTLSPYSRPVVMFNPNYVNLMQPVNIPIQNQQLLNPAYIYPQQQQAWQANSAYDMNKPQQNNWAPALPLSYQNQHVLGMMQSMQTDPYTNPSTSSNVNNWDPATSTQNDSVYSTNLTNLSNNNNNNKTN